MMIGDTVCAVHDLGIGLRGPRVPAGAPGMVQEHDGERGAYRVDFGPFHGGSRWVSRDDLAFAPNARAARTTAGSAGGQR